MNKILISPGSFGKINDAAIDKLKANGFEITLNPYGKTLSKEQSADLLKENVGLIAGTELLDEEIFSMHPQLKYICRLGVGMDSVDIQAANSRGIKVENTPLAHVDGVAELCLAGILNALRKVSQSHQDLLHVTWKKPMGSLLRGKKIGLIGLGNVAKRLVELLQPFDVQIVATDLFWDNAFATQYGIEKSDTNSICAACDIISVHLPINESTRHIIGEKQFGVTKKNVLVVNTSRGGIIDENALLNFLTKNENAFAYLDVFESEPYNGELIKCKNVLLTPHIGSYAKEVRTAMEMECAEKTIKFFK